MRLVVRPVHDEKRSKLIALTNVCGTGEKQAAWRNLATSYCVFCS